ncbi:hypothetical protein HLK59_03245 [Streptomyces sp. S3(2020)]|uniref:hypothetical protein n=1 Tax=Streptomyces sp. S3(2020) TaxID=2732044 RepID=UPI001487DD0A|nr:hypothetical protein [Streptomyces sp. S3(2020)]NNN29385.1 hypothetical protein [Streptomyces sp. S3(2020)]
MTITTGTVSPPARSTPVALARGILTGAVIGASSAAVVVGALIESVPLFAGGLVLPVAYVLLVLLADVPRLAREAAITPHTALAMVESLEAVGGEATSDVAVRFDLTVAPEDVPAYRVAFKQDINLVDLADYRPGVVVVVQYPPDRPWRVRIVRRPTPQWEERAAGARLDSAPGPAMVSETPRSCAVGLVMLLALLLAAGGVVLGFRADLFGEGAAARSGSSDRPAVSSSSSSSSSTTVVSSASATVALGPGQSFLDKGELRKAVGSLTKGTDGRAALTVVVQDRLLSVVYAPTGSQAPTFDLDSPPYDRVPDLVEEARTGLGVGSPQTWQVTVERLTGSLTVRVGVTGPGGTASLEADGDGTVVRRTAAR